MPTLPAVARTRAALLLAVVCLATAASAPAAPASVEVRNDSRPTRCAEEDNVSLVLQGEGVRRLRIEALQPDYLAQVERDITAPDFSACNFDGGDHPTDPKFSFTPRRQMLHDGQRWQIVGLTLPVFWRPDQVPVSVDGRSDRGFHLIQLFRKPSPGGRPAEVLVMYPADGYWRLKPLPEPRFGDGVYGSSFLFGPVTREARPVVEIDSIRITTRPLAFHLSLAGGNTASVRIGEVSRRRTALDVRFQQPIAGDSPFAVLRSMYVSDDNADVSEVRTQSRPGAPWQTVPLSAVTTLQGTALRFGRSVVSRHNTSAPDMLFDRFSAGD